jgi:hypothetical protein
MVERKKEYLYYCGEEGSPAQEEYKRKVLSGELKIRGRPPLTDEQKKKSRERRKEYLRKYQQVRRRRHNIRKNFFTYEEAKQRIQQEAITSRGQYKKWHKLNYPAKMPQAPEDYYRRTGDWIGWGDFLGVYNDFPNIAPIKFRPYKDASAYAHLKGIKTRDEWFELCRNDPSFPSDIPKRPDIAYYKTGDWFSWKEFLGSKFIFNGIKQEITELNDKILYILRIPNNLNNKLYRIGITLTGWSSITNAIKTNNLIYVSSYIIDDEKKIDQIIKSHCIDTEMHGVYEVDMIFSLMSDIEMYFSKYNP